jgi:hypothetical protein
MAEFNTADSGPGQIGASYDVIERVAKDIASRPHKFG